MDYDVFIAEGRPKVKVDRIRAIPDENQIAEITFDEVFNHCEVGVLIGPFLVRLILSKREEASVISLKK